MTILLVLAGLLALPLLWSSLRVPAVRRVAFRNVLRRRGEAALITGGAMLATAIIAASIVTGDVIDASIRSGAENFLGPIDVRVRTEDPTTLPALADQVRAADHEDVDDVLAWVGTTGSVVADDRGEGRVGLAEVDLAAARDFGGDVDATGLADVQALPAGHAVVPSNLAQTLEVEAGDTVTIHAFGNATDLEVAAVLPATGLVGYGEILTPSGTLTELAGGPSPGLQSEVLVSTTGGVADAVEPSEATMAGLRGLVGADVVGSGAAVSVEAVKADLLAEADEVGEEFTTLFSSIGSFGVIAGILLLINLFVMLAEERRRDLGTLRALGMRRSLLARTFALEGSLYALAAAVVGTALGALLGVGVANVASSILGISGDGLTFRPVIEPASLLTAGLIGFVISLVTAWVLSARIARANIVRSLRELPEPPKPHRVRTMVMAGLGVAAGTLLTVSGISSGVPESILAGVPIAVVAAVPILRRFMPVKLAMAASGSASLAWALLATRVWATEFASGEITVFVVQGVVMTAGAVAVLASADRAWARLADVLLARTGGLAARLGTAYPLARRFRTSMLLGMFAVVVFTITFIASIDGVFTGAADDFAADSDAAYDLVVEAPASAVGIVDGLEQRDDVAGVAPLTRVFGEFATGDDTTRWAITGFDESLLGNGGPRLAQRAEGHADDAAAFAAVLGDPGLAIVNDSFLSGGGPGGVTPGVGDTVELIDGAGVQRSLEVVGVLAADALWHGGFVHPEVAEAVAGPANGSSLAYVEAAPGIDPETLASTINAEMVTLGADAETFTGIVAEEMAEQSSFFRLLQVFLGLGLVIGIAGLGVVLVRAVRERTRQVGTLRALGVQRATVARAFLVEAGFVAVQGVLVGAVLGLVSAWQVLTNTATFGDMDMAFRVPWVPLLVIVAVPLVAAVAATWQPARRAASIQPAVALRFAD